MNKRLLFTLSILARKKWHPRILLLLLLSFLSIGTRAQQQWYTLGAEGQVTTAATAYYSTSVAVLDTVPYVVYFEGSGATAAGRVKRKNPTTGSWEQVGNDLSTNLGYSRLYVDKTSNLFVAYIDYTSSSKLAIKMYDTATSTWIPMNGVSSNLYVSTGTANGASVVGNYNSSARFSMAFNSNNEPYIAYAEGANQTPYVKKFDGTSWVTIGTGPVDAAIKAVGMSLVLDEADDPWLAFSSLTANNSATGSLALYKNNGTTWSPITVSIGGIRHTSMALNSANNLAIAYFNTGNSNKATVVVYDKVAGTFGTPISISGRDAPAISLIRDYAGNLYCSFVDAVTSSSYSAARVMKQDLGTTTWREIKDPLVIRGIDEPTTSLAIAIGSDTARPTVVYLKSSSTTLTPIVRRYMPPPPPASLTTAAGSNFMTTSVGAGGNVTSDGGTTVTERGVVYSTTANPTTANTKVIATTGGTGAFSVTINGLTPATLYNVRAYAINGGGTQTTYGENVRISTLATPDAVVTAAKQMELLNRGLVAVRSTTSKVYVGWRLLGTDPSGIAFNLYRDGVKINASPITATTNYEDNISTNGTYTVKPIIGGTEGAASAPASVWANNQLSIPLQIPPDGVTRDGEAYTYNANDASVGDVDGDGEYEIFLKWDPSNAHDNTGEGVTGSVYIDCYKLNGTRLWRINLGKNIRAGAHYTQFMVYDLDGDGKAELACKTADSTVDGVGVVIGNPSADYRDVNGRVLSGPEYLTVFNGLTGAAMATVNFEPARGAVTDWGDSYGNRVDRFISAIAYLDGARPSLIMGRGYYGKLVRAAYDWRNGQLTQRWIFTTDTPGNEAFGGQGNHQMSVGDVDGDGKDEILNGSSMVNDNGARLWTNGNGHGDALHMTDMDLEHPGQEIWINLESPTQYTPYGLRQLDAKTGQTIWGKPTGTADVGRSMTGDIDPSRNGFEMWGSSGDLYDVKGNFISTNKPTYNFGIWWDGDPGRELLDGTKIDKWNYLINSSNRLFTIYQAAPISSNNSTKSNPCLTADLLGDWREEMIFRRADNTALILFTTTIPTDQRIYTLMHDLQYREAIAWQNSGYNQPPYPSFYLGYNMPTPPTPNIYLAGQTILPVKLLTFTAKPRDNKEVIVEWSATEEKNNKYYVVERSADGKNFTVIETLNDKGNSGSINRYTITDYQPLTGVSYYRLKQVDADGKFTYSDVRTVKLSKEKILMVYPNPVSASVKLELMGSIGNLTISINSIDGKILYQGRGTLTTINVSVNHLLPSLKPGYYSVTLTDAEGTYETQLIKQ